MTHPDNGANDATRAGANAGNTVRKQLSLPHPREKVWHALTDSATLAQWLHPNDFESRVGHRFTFKVPAKPEVGFEGLTVQSEVLELDAPARLVLAWNAAPPVADTRVTFELEAVEADGPDQGHTLLRFEHSGFDLDHPFGKHAFKGAEYGWGELLGKLESNLNTSRAPEAERKDPA